MILLVSYFLIGGGLILTIVSIILLIRLMRKNAKFSVDNFDARFEYESNYNPINTEFAGKRRSIVTELGIDRQLEQEEEEDLGEAKTAVL